MKLWLLFVGLWTFDLAVSQLLLERVNSGQRGVVNGVQSSLNMIMDMLKFVLVIAIPKPEHFGLLIILSFCFICFGGVSYGIYSHKATGHVFHCGECYCLKKPSVEDPPDKDETQTLDKNHQGNAESECHTWKFVRSWVTCNLFMRSCGLSCQVWYLVSVDGIGRVMQYKYCGKLLTCAGFKLSLFMHSREVVTI